MGQKGGQASLEPHLSSGIRYFSTTLHYTLGCTAEVSPTQLNPVKTPSATQWVPKITSSVPRKENGRDCVASFVTETPNAYENTVLRVISALFGVSFVPEMVLEETPWLEM